VGLDYLGLPSTAVDGGVQVHRHCGRHRGQQVIARRSLQLYAHGVVLAVAGLQHGPRMQHGEHRGHGRRS
jgi:hypothetical protein